MNTSSFPHVSSRVAFLADNVSFSECLPNLEISQKPKEGLQKIRHLAATLSLAIEGLELLLQRAQLSRFDARIGEERCQVRAFLIAALARGGDVDGDLAVALERLGELRSSFQKAKETLELDSKTPLPPTERLRLTGSVQALSLRRSFLVAIACYIIRKLSHEEAAPFFEKEPGNSVEHFLPTHLKSGGHTSVVVPEGLSKAFCQNLVKLSQKFVADSSVQFLKAVVQDDCDLDVSCGVQTDRDRPRLPFFFTNHFLFQEMLRAEVPIVCVGHLVHPDKGYVGRAQVVFVVREGTYILSSSQVDPEKRSPAIVVEGSRQIDAEDVEEAQREFHSFVAEAGIQDLFLANSAAHYPRSEGIFHSEDADLTLDRFFPLIKKNREDYQQRAVELGCISGEREGFLIRHVFADTLQAALEPAVVEEQALEMTSQEIL